MYGVVRGRVFVIEIFECFVKMDEDQWMLEPESVSSVDTKLESKA